MTEPAKVSCPRCGAAFECGVAAGKSSCWCFEKPRMADLPREFDSCLCPACLEEVQNQAKAQE
ncbi:MAG: cysteine-rich CWC family protein [Verrucomicrobiia bacterium]